MAENVHYTTIRANILFARRVLGVAFTIFAIFAIFAIFRILSRGMRSLLCKTRLVTLFSMLHLGWCRTCGVLAGVLIITGICMCVGDFSVRTVAGILVLVLRWKHGKLEAHWILRMVQAQGTSCWHLLTTDLVLLLLEEKPSCHLFGRPVWCCFNHRCREKSCGSCFESLIWYVAFPNFRICGSLFTRRKNCESL